MSKIPTFDQCTSEAMRLLRTAEKITKDGSQYTVEHEVDRVLAIASQWMELAELVRSR